MTGVEFIRRIEVGNVLGEGVLWNERRKSVWWTDIESSRLYEYRSSDDTLNSWDTPHRVACFGFVENSDDQLVVAFDRGIALFDVYSGDVDWLLQPGVLPRGQRFNDGKIDPFGRFWVGTMVEDSAAATEAAALYCFDPEIGLIERISDLSISNGLCWSPQGTFMYHADSPQHEICVYRFEAGEGSISHRRSFATTPSGIYPDGSTVDSDGGVWNAQWCGGQVLRYGPDGHVSLALELPVSQPTCVAFGGPGFNLLFVTTATTGLADEDLAQQPGAGDLFVYRTSFSGMPASRFVSPRSG